MMGIIMVVGVSTANSVLVGSFARDRFDAGLSAYDAAIDAIHEAIRRGETYQVNHTFRLNGQAFGSPLDLYRRLRERQVTAKLRPREEMLALRVWAFAARRPRVYAWLSRWGARLLRLLANSGGMITRLPLAGEWTRGRHFPAPQPGGTFRDQYAARKRPTIPAS